MRIAAAVFGYLAAFFLAAMMLLTVADVLLRTIFLALPAVFLRDEHLVVDVIDHFTRPAVVRMLDLAGAVISLAVLVVMAWQMVPLARLMHEFGDVTSDLSIPRIYYWIPVLLGVVASALATFAFIVRWRRGGSSGCRSASPSSSWAPAATRRWTAGARRSP